MRRRLTPGPAAATTWARAPLAAGRKCCRRRAGRFPREHDGLGRARKGHRNSRCEHFISRGQEWKGQLGELRTSTVEPAPDRHRRGPLDGDVVKDQRTAETAGDIHRHGQRGACGGSFFITNMNCHSTWRRVGCKFRAATPEIGQELPSHEEDRDTSFLVGAGSVRRSRVRARSRDPTDEDAKS